MKTVSYLRRPRRAVPVDDLPTRKGEVGLFHKKQLTAQQKQDAREAVAAAHPLGAPLPEHAALYTHNLLEWADQYEATTKASH